MEGALRPSAPATAPPRFAAPPERADRWAATQPLPPPPPGHCRRPATAATAVQEWSRRRGWPASGSAERAARAARQTARCAARAAHASFQLPQRLRSIASRAGRCRRASALQQPRHRTGQEATGHGPAPPTRAPTARTRQTPLCASARPPAKTTVVAPRRTRAARPARAERRRARQTARRRRRGYALPSPGWRVNHPRARRSAPPMADRHRHSRAARGPRAGCRARARRAAAVHRGGQSWVRVARCDGTRQSDCRAASKT